MTEFTHVYQNAILEVLEESTKLYTDLVWTHIKRLTAEEHQTVLQCGYNIHQAWRRLDWADADEKTRSVAQQELEKMRQIRARFEV